MKDMPTLSFRSAHLSAVFVMPSQLYIENDFSSDAFTSSHIQLLSLLCSQAALSIDNARLYSQLSVSNLHLHQLLAQRTSELESLQVAMDSAEKAMRIKSEFLSNVSIGTQSQLLLHFRCSLSHSRIVC